MVQIAIVADDLTGAADTGARFASTGSFTVVSFRPGRLPQADVLALSTNGRNLSQAEATRRVREASDYLPSDSMQRMWIYKKIDSTLRGHPAAELSTLMDALAIDRALIAPAFPQQHRTTRQGCQLIDGWPFATTSFGQEVPTSNLVDLFQRTAGDRPVCLIDLAVVRRGMEPVAEMLRQTGASLFVADAETDADLKTLAQAATVGGIRLLCGSAGLAGALQKVLEIVPAVRSLKFPEPPDGPVLTVAGSRHHSTARQIEVSCSAGAVVLCPRSSPTMQGSQLAEIVSTAGEQMSRGQDVILTTLGMADHPDRQAVTVMLSRIVTALIERTEMGGLILTGGETAVTVCSELQSTSLCLQGEIEPGIPWSRFLDGKYRGLPVVTKAGGFGADDALVVAGRFLRALSGGR